VVAILAVTGTAHRFVRRPDGTTAWRPIADMTLTCDHRAVDGAEAAQFLGSFRQLLEGDPAADDARAAG
jgi:pyruvate dehydrogenase E2 component (dihydrolipoamide acetyltransferase)